MQVISLPDPVLRWHDGIQVVRDDLLPGGTKRRAIHVFFRDDCSAYVYASPVYGAAQLALAHAARDYQKDAQIFCAKRKVWHPMTQAAHDAGAAIIEVPHGYLSNVSAKARLFCAATGAQYLPFGLDAPEFITALAAIAAKLPVQPTEVWSITSSGVLTRALQMAWPDAKFYGVRVGAAPNAGKAEVILAPEAFEKPAKEPPLFPSSVYYDAKAWRFIKRHATPGALFWNVAS